MNVALWSIVGIAFILAITAMSLIRPVLVRLGAIDVPNHRSSHSIPIVRGAGIALAIPLLVVTFAVTLSGASWKAESLMAVPLMMAVLAAAVGAVEDVKGIAARYRFLLQLGIGTGGTFALVAITNTSLWWVPIGAFVTATYINTANFMDGINGISGLHGLVCGFIYGAIGMITDAAWMTVCGLLIAVLFTAFLPWNLLGGRMFLGDSGSYLLGCSIAATAVAGLLTGTHPLALLGPTVIYLADVGSTLIRRIRAGEKWTEAHRTHVYQRLTEGPLSHIQVAGIVNVLAFGAGFVGLLSLDWSLGGSLLAAILMGCLAVGYLLGPKLVATSLRNKSPLTRYPPKEEV